MPSLVHQLPEQRTVVRDAQISNVEFRRVMGHLPTGVAVVAALVDGAPVGMAINSITSVSLDPPLIAICIDNKSTTWPYIRATGGFTVSILSCPRSVAMPRSRTSSSGG